MVSNEHLFGFKTYSNSKKQKFCSIINIFTTLLGTCMKIFFLHTWGFTDPQKRMGIWEQEIYISIFGLWTVPLCSAEQSQSWPPVRFTFHGIQTFACRRRLSPFPRPLQLQQRAWTTQRRSPGADIINFPPILHSFVCFYSLGPSPTTQRASSSSSESLRDSILGNICAFWRMTVLWMV